MDSVRWIFVLACFSVFYVFCAPMSNLDMKKYLRSFGYTRGKEINKMHLNEVKQAIKDFQELNALPITGILDVATKNMMNRPRCGHPDKEFVPSEHAAFFKIGSKWNKRHLTYRLNNYPRNNFGTENTIKETKRAFNLWSNVANITFEQISEGTPDINIFYWEKKDGDGPGRILAQAYYPEKGDVYFDDEDWTLMGHSGVNYFQVATHEIGHSLGIPHQLSAPEAVMAPYYHGYLPNFNLHSTDIASIQDKYGPNRMASTGNSFCNSMKLDVVFASNSNTIYVLNNAQVWKYIGKQLQRGYPKVFEKVWPGLPMNIDVAYHLKGVFYFFKDRELYVYKGGRRETTSDISITSKIDAAFAMLDRIYVFVGNLYFKFALYPHLELQKGFPREISSFWKGVPDYIDTVYYDYNRTIYFFKNKTMYKFDTFTKSAVGEDVSNWFPCRENKVS